MIFSVFQTESRNYYALFTQRLATCTESAGVIMRRLDGSRQREKYIELFTKTYLLADTRTPSLATGNVRCGTVPLKSIAIQVNRNMLKRREHARHYSRPGIGCLLRTLLRRLQVVPERIVWGMPGPGRFSLVQGIEMLP